jgi:hypothetical protein
MHQHECGIFAGRFMVRLGRRRRDHFRSQSGRVLLSGRHRRSHRRTDITTNRIDATRESTSRIPRGPNNGLLSTKIMSWYARTATRIDTTRATTSCRPRGPCIWYAFYGNVVLYLVCTYVARIAEPIGGPQPKGWEGGRGGKAQRTIHQMEGSGSKRSRRIAEPARNKTNNATSSSKKRIAAAPYILLDWPQLFTLAMTSILRCRLDHISTHKRRQMEGGKIATQ